jgi:hypothetical protein
MTVGRVLQPILQLAFAALLSVSTLVFGAMPLLWLRRSTHPLIYIVWCTFTILLGTQIFGFEMWMPFLLNSLLVFFYVLFESMWVELVTVTSFSVLLTGSLTFFSLSVWMASKGQSLSAVLREKAQAYATYTMQLWPSVKVDVDTLVPQIPWAFLAMLSVSLWIALLSESPWASRTKDGGLRISKLQGFQIPESYIWIFLASVFFALADLGLPAAQKVAVNVFYLSIILYFFQGVAIIGTFFHWQRWGQVWQVIAYVLFITQLFLAVSLLGLVDFWLDFRNRMVKKSAQRTGEVEQ